MFQQNKKKSSLISTITICVVLVILTILLVTYKQNIIDQISVWQYNPTAEITGFTDRSGMNGQGKFLFFASQPKLDSTSNFNTECDRVEQTTAILGCYNNFRIYIYNVTDPQVDGVREVTAAHEMLHAAYARLSSDDKTKLDKLLETEYDKLKNNSEFADLIAFYDKAEPGQRDNELHSIIGTQVAVVSPELETHYKQYFSDRQKVVALDVKYESVFNQNKATADALLAQYNALGASISSKTAEYNSEVQTLNKDITTFNNRANSGNFSTMAEFNSQRSVLSARAASLETLRASIENNLAKYQSIFTQYNQIATQSKKLFNLLNSSLAPAPSL